MAIFRGRQTPAPPYGLRKGPLLTIGLIVGTVIVWWLNAGPWGSSEPVVVQKEQAHPIEPTAGKVTQAFPSQYQSKLPPVPVVAQTNGQMPQEPHDETWKVQQQAKLDAALQAIADLKRQMDANGAPTPKKTADDGRNAAMAAEKAKTDARKHPHVHVAAKSTTAPLGVKAQAHPYTISAGWLLPVIFEDQLSNQSPGIAKFVVREPVKDSATGRHTLIPQGSFGLVRVTTGQIFGTERLSVQVLSLSWPNGDHLPLPNAHAGDQTGQSGLRDLVDRRWGQLFASVILTGVLRGGTSMLISSSTSGANQVAQAVAAESAREGQESVQQFIDTSPILTIRQGFLASIRLEQELVVGKAYGD